MRIPSFSPLQRFFTIALLLLGTAAAAAQDFYLRDGDRVVFYGDSITRLRLYTSFVETFVLTRFPGKNIYFVQSGVGGDRVSGGGAGDIKTRLPRDVYYHTPSVVTVMLGMNDARLKPFDQGLLDNYKRGMDFIVADIKKNLPSARITLIQPSPYDDVTQPPKFTGGYNAVLLRYGEVVKALAEKEKTALADLNTPVVQMLERAKAINPALAKKIYRDRVHPYESGHLILAAALLESWNAPSLVSAVTIDAAAQKATAEENTSISHLRVSPEGLSWQQHDRALPMHVNRKNPETVLAVAAYDFTEKLNRQPLRITKLPAQTDYELRVDNQSVGIFSAATLSSGINLTEFDTPMMQQAAAVYDLVYRRAELHERLWLDTQVPLEKSLPSAQRPQLQQFIAAAATTSEKLAELQHSLAQPKPRQFTLRTVSSARATAAKNP